MDSVPACYKIKLETQFGENRCTQFRVIVITPTNTLTNTHTHNLRQSGKNSAKNRDPDHDRISTKIKRFVASETSHRSKKIVRIRRQLLELSA